MGAKSTVPIWLWPWLAFLVLLPLEAFLNLLGWGILLNLLGGGAALLVALNHRGGNDNPREARSRSLFGTGLAIAMLLSIFSSLDPESTRSELISVGMIWGVYVLMSLVVLSRRQLFLSMRAWLWGGALMAVLTIFSAATGNIRADGRLSLAFGGISADPNYLIAELIIPFAIGLTLIRRPRHRIEGLVTVLLIVAAECLSQSRGGFLALGTVVLAGLCWRRRYSTMVLCGGVLLGSYLFLTPMLGRMDVAADLTGNRRTEIWAIALEEGFKHWETGIGIGALPVVTSSAQGLYWSRDSHNTWVQAFSECGFLGFLMLGATFWIHLRGPRRGWVGVMQAGLLGILVAGIFLHLMTLRFLWMAWLLTSQACLKRRSPVVTRFVANKEKEHAEKSPDRSHGLHSGINSRACLRLSSALRGRHQRDGGRSSGTVRRFSAYTAGWTHLPATGARVLRLGEKHQ